MENNVQTSKIGVRDLVNVAIFTVIYFVIFYVCAMTGFVPVMAVFYPVLTAIIAGIPCILFYTKVKFPDGIWILRSDYRHCLWLAGRCHYEGWKI